MNKKISKTKKKLEQEIAKLKNENRKLREKNKEFKEERELFKVLINTLPDQIFVKDKDHKFVLANNGCAESLNADSPEDAIGKTDYDFLPRNRCKAFFEEEDYIIKNDAPIIQQEQKFTWKGTVFWLSVTKLPWKDSQGNIKGVIGLNRNITLKKEAQLALKETKENLEQRVKERTAELQKINNKLRKEIAERKKTEKQLQDERNLLRTLFDHIPAKVFVKDKNSRFTTANRETLDSVGLDNPEQIVGKTDFDFCCRDNANELFQKEQEVIKTGKPHFNEETSALDDGRKKWTRTTKVPIKNEDGKVTGILGIAVDITEQKKNEKKLIDYQNKLRELNSELSLAEERLRSRIAREIHDHIGQNLAFSKIKLKQLKQSDNSDPEISNEILELIDQTIQSTRTLTFELSCPILYELGFGSAVKWLLSQLKDRHSINTEYKKISSLDKFDDDTKVLLFQAVRELAINVVKHAQAENLKIKTENVGKTVRITVEDDGSGFDVEKKKNKKYGKKSFGLFSLKDRLDLIGGNLKIVSEIGQGTKAVITVPSKKIQLKKEN